MMISTAEKSTLNVVFDHYIYNPFVVSYPLGALSMTINYFVAIQGLTMCYAYLLMTMALCVVLSLCACITYADDIIREVWG